MATLWTPRLVHPTNRYWCESALNCSSRDPLNVIVATCLLLSSGCGGGASPSSAQVSVTPADFSIQLSPSSLTLSQGTTTSATTLSVTPQNGFGGTVQVTLSGLPTGMAGNPASPFAIAAGSNVSLIFGASTNAATGNFPVTATRSSGRRIRRHNGAAVTVGGKTASVTFKDVNTLTVITPVVSPGPQQIIITNPDGQSIALDAAFIAN